MRQYLIDAFANAPFRGNPACVAEPVDTWPADGWMQQLAAENNQAETAFLLRSGEPGRYGLRWFTPTQEAPLCGHATLASAHALLAELGETSHRLVFDTLSGPLAVTRHGRLYEMDFPAMAPHRIEPPAGLASALGFEPLEVWAAQFIVALAKDEDQVRQATPNIAALKLISAGATHGRGNVGISAVAHERPYEVVSRFFAPGFGIPEDPVTGSLHCILSPLFAAKLGKPVIRFHQAYPGRGGDLECENMGERVLLRGEAVTVAESVLRL